MMFIPGRAGYPVPEADTRSDVTFRARITCEVSGAAVFIPRPVSSTAGAGGSFVISMQLPRAAKANGSCSGVSSSIEQMKHEMKLSDKALNRVSRW